MQRSFACVVASVVAACGTVLGSPADDPVPSRPDDVGGDASGADARAADASDAAEESCLRRLPCGGTELAAGGELASPPSRLCLETCVRLAWDASGFGDGGSDYVKIVDVGVLGDAERAGGFNVGLAQQPYLFADGVDGFALFQWPAGLPPERWTHLRIDIRYATAPTAELYVDGEVVAERAIPPLRVVPTKVVVTRGPIASGTHPEVDLRFASLRLTRY